MKHLYMTDIEFAEFCVQQAREQGYCAEGREDHPEDLATNLSMVMQAVAAGMGEAIRRQAGRK